MLKYIMADETGFDRFPFPNPEQDPRREEAIAIANRINRIVGSFGNKFPTRRNEPTTFRTPEGYLVTKTPDKHFIFSKTTDLLRGHGHNYDYDIPVDEGEQPKDTRVIQIMKDSNTKPIGLHLEKPLGIKTQYELYIGIHSDSQTLKDVEENPQHDNLLGSFYYFDENGNYGKAISLPPGIEDNRKVLKTNDSSGYRYVHAEMESGDFELVNFAIEILEKGIQENPTTK